MMVLLDIELNRNLSGLLSIWISWNLDDSLVSSLRGRLLAIRGSTYSPFDQKSCVVRPYPRVMPLLRDDRSAASRPFWLARLHYAAYSALFSSFAFPSVVAYSTFGC